MTFEVAVVTPMKAERWLQEKAENRVVRKAVVSLYARMMSEGEWRLTHQAIAFDEDGKLIDGQHRLLAVIVSGVSIPMAIARGVASDAFEAMDRHIKRSVSDCLRIDGAVASTVQAGWGFTDSGRKFMLTPGDVRRVLDEHGASVEFAVRNVVGRHMKGITTAAVAGIIARAHAAGEEEERLKQFCDVLASGEPMSMPDDQAALRTRNLLIDMTSRNHALQPVRRKIMRGIRAFLDREPITKLYQADCDLF